VVQAIDRSASGAFLLANRRLLDVGVSITVLMLGGSPVVLAAAILWVRHACLWRCLRQQNAGLPANPGLSSCELGELANIWKPALGYLGIPSLSDHPARRLADAQSHCISRSGCRIHDVENADATSDPGRRRHKSGVEAELSRLAGAGRYLEAKTLTVRASLLVFGAVLLVTESCLAWADVIAWWAGKGGCFECATALVGIHSVLNLAWFVPAALLILTNTHARVGAFTRWRAQAVCLWLACVSMMPGPVGASLLLAVPELAVAIYVITRNRQCAVRARAVRQPRNRHGQQRPWTELHPRGPGFPRVTGVRANVGAAER
jgi:hypothetical protein